MPGPAWHRRMIRMKMAHLPPLDMAPDVSPSRAKECLKLIDHIKAEHGKHLTRPERVILNKLKAILRSKVHDDPPGDRSTEDPEVRVPKDMSDGIRDLIIYLAHMAERTILWTSGPTEDTRDLAIYEDPALCVELGRLRFTDNGEIVAVITTPELKEALEDLERTEG